MQASGDQSAIFGRDGAPSPRRQGPLSVLRSVVAWGFPCLRRDDALVYSPPMSPLAIIALILATVAALEGVAWTSHKYFRWAPRRGYAKRLVQAHKLHHATAGNEAARASVSCWRSLQRNSRPRGECRQNVRTRGQRGAREAGHE